MKYVLAFVVLSVIIMIHEFGHFVVAKASGVMVTEFSLGMGPRLIKFTKKGTMYSLKLFLFGGSCRMLGEDENQDMEGSFNNASVWRRMAIVVAGPLFNFISAFIFSVILIGKAGYDPCVVYDVTENTPAEEAGLQAGDRITKVNGTKVNFYGDYALFITEYEDDTMHITYERDGEKYTTTLEPEHIVEDVYQMGVYINTDEPSINSVMKDTPAAKAGVKTGDLIKSINGTEINSVEDIAPIVRACDGNEITVVVLRDGTENTLKFTPESVHSDYYERGLVLSAEREKCSPINTLKYAFKQIGYWIKSVFKSFKLLFGGKISANDVAGPVGIVSAIGKVVDESKSDGALYVFLNLLNWIIMISANLGVMNLLPIPALDGGRLLFLIIEAVRRKPVDREKEGMVHFIGIILLMILMVVVLFNDIRKLF